MKRSRAIFSSDVSPEIDKIVESIGKKANKQANFLLNDHRNLFGADVPLSEADLKRLLGQATRQAFRETLLAPRIQPILAKLDGEIPCSSRELRSRIRSAPTATTDDVFALLALYGHRNGMKPADARLLGLESMTFEFAIARGEERVFLRRIRTNPIQGFTGAPMGVATRTSGFTRNASDVDFEIPEELEDLLARIAIALITIGLSELWECLTGDDDPEDKLDSAIEEVEEAIEELEEEIDELEDEIEDLRRERREEEDEDDRQELQEEIDEKNEEKREKERAKESAEDGLRDLRRARSQLN